ncbi:hypothetical protein [Pantoea ananatis]|uniref:hypothetical protein n=1 Tax=Pantoea ananas TaxID=553 RepID=UPI001B3055D8|nr:hypothetical protein [Pantoea ananatis]
MAKVYEFPQGGRSGQKALYKRKPGKLSLWFKRTSFGFYIKSTVANALHYPVMTVLLLAMKIRYPVAILGTAYFLHFFTTHHNSLWVSGNYSALYTLIVVLFFLLSGLAANQMEAKTPFHKLFRAYRKESKSDAANDEN